MLLLRKLPRADTIYLRQQSTAFSTMGARLLARLDVCDSACDSALAKSSSTYNDGTVGGVRESAEGPGIRV